MIQEEVEKRHKRLEEAHKAQQYYFDAAEAEAWMSEQELYMMSEEKAKVKKDLCSLYYIPIQRVLDSQEEKYLQIFLKVKYNSFSKFILLFSEDYFKVSIL